ncbi:MAG: LytTR family transcriptional regulator, partial [Chitinophagaceae bacterium]
FLAELNCENFVRVHRSFVVNLQKVEKINHTYLVIDDKQVPLSRNYREPLLSRLRIK